jgi:hypothetical protein
VLVNATNRNFYSPPQVSLEILKSSGTFNVIEDENIKAEIVNFNGLINTYINYSQFTLAAEHAMDTTTAGIISRQALRSIIVNVYSKTNAQYGSITQNDLPSRNLLKTYDKNVYINFVKSWMPWIIFCTICSGYIKNIERRNYLIGSFKKRILPAIIYLWKYIATLILKGKNSRIISGSF